MTLNHKLLFNLSLLLVFNPLTLATANQLKLMNASILVSDSTAELQVEIQNTAAEMMNIILRADIYKSSGELQKRANSEAQVIPANSIGRFYFPLSNVESGVYKALVVGQYIPIEGAQEYATATLLREYIAPFELPEHASGPYVIKDEMDYRNLEEDNREAIFTAIQEEQQLSLATLDELKEETPFQRENLEIDSQGFVYYTIQPGDWLSKIAAKFYGDKMRFLEIYDANRDLLDNADELHPGQRLRIPVRNQAYVIHTVQPGEWLSTIAKEYYGDPLKYSAIFEVNSETIKDANQIHPGQVLEIPLLKADEMMTRISAKGEVKYEQQAGATKWAGH